MKFSLYSMVYRENNTKLSKRKKIVNIEKQNLWRNDNEPIKYGELWHGTDTF